jgi:hypothetical protein
MEKHLPSCLISRYKYMFRNSSNGVYMKSTQWILSVYYFYAWTCEVTALPSKEDRGKNKLIIKLGKQSKLRNKQLLILCKALWLILGTHHWHIKAQL